MRINAFLAICIITAAAPLTAQKLPSFTQQADSVFKNLDKRYITTGILYDRVYPSAMLHIFNTPLFDTTNARHFKQAYYELYNAKYFRKSLTRPDTIDQRIASLTSAGKVPIGIINFAFNQIDTHAIAANLIEDRNGIFYDVPSRQKSPYWKKQVSIISPMVDSIAGLTAIFETSPLLYLQNTGHSIASLQADFGDGNGLRDVSPRNPVQVTYASFGQKIIKFIIRYQNNTRRTTYAYLKMARKKIVASRAAASACDRDDRITASIPFTDYENNTFKGQGNIHYYFSTGAPCNGMVKKPIIILDGFDPGDERSISQLYDEYMNNPARYPFGDEMRNKGYDIVVLNFPEYRNELGKAVDGGADYIERNAFVLMELISELNRQLSLNGSAEKLVIIGPSMGGMISRYALAWMEKNGIPHNTRLWISLDAPHNGANIPIGAQKFIEFFANNGNKGAEETLQKQLNNPAAKQQLLHHYLSYSDTPRGAPGFRERFATALALNGVSGSHGFPLIPRKVAIVNGSLNGSLQPGSYSCQEVLHAKSYLAVDLFLFKTKLFRIAQARIYFAGSYGNRCTVLSASQLFKGDVAASGGAPMASVSYDIAPGGLRTSFTTLAEAGQGYSSFFQFLIELGSYTEFEVYHGAHSFVPTKSALAFAGANGNLAENLYDRNLVCTGETPFDSYYGNTINTEHSYIDSGMAKFAIAEIEGRVTRPTYVASNPSLYISGPDDFCDPAATYSLQGGAISPGASLSWSLSPAIANISYGKDSTEVSLIKTSNGTATLSLQLTAACGLSQGFTKIFSTFGYSNAGIPLSGPSSACNNQKVYFNIKRLPGAVYNWKWPAGWTYITGQGTNSLVLITGDTSGPVSVNVSQACDIAGSDTTQYVKVNNCNFAFRAFPNPSSGEVTITTGEVKNKASASVTDKMYTLEVRDMFGKIKRKFSYATGITDIMINLRNLGKGTYVIYVYNGKAWAYRMMVITR